MELFASRAFVSATYEAQADPIVLVFGGAAGSTPGPDGPAKFVRRRGRFLAASNEREKGQPSPQFVSWQASSRQLAVLLPNSDAISRGEVELLSGLDLIRVVPGIEIADGLRALAGDVRRSWEHDEARWVPFDRLHAAPLSGSLAVALEVFRSRYR